MKIVQLTDEITVLQTQEFDKWGLPTLATETILPAKVSMRLHNDRGHDDTLVPDGNILLEGQIILKSTDRIRTVLTDGKTYELKPDTIKHIKDLTGNVIYTKVSFNGEG